MQIIVSDSWLNRGGVSYLSGRQMAAMLTGLAFVLVVLTSLIYQWVFIKGMREGWPIVGNVAKWVVQDEFQARDKFMRANIDAMAKKLGEMQAKIIRLEALGERVGTAAGVNVKEFKLTPVSSAASSAAQGGVFMPQAPKNAEEFEAMVNSLDEAAQERMDLLTLMESRLSEQKFSAQLIPTQFPVAGGQTGSPFGWRADPFSRRSAFHAGLDFPADTGTPILSAAGGVVVTQEFHHAYGNIVEVDHGNNLVTRYAHASKIYVKVGDLVKRGQRIADVGSTGRSTGPHLHFEVLVNGVPHDPAPFLRANNQTAAQVAEKAGANLKR